MQIEQFFYWFSDPTWWMGASQGAVGALIGFVGLFLAYRLTQIGEKKKRAEERTLASVASVMQSCISLSQKHPYDITDEELHALQIELMLFHVHQLSDRPNTATWALRQSLMIKRRKHLGFETPVARAIAGKIVEDLSAWLSKGCRDGLLDPDRVVDEWKNYSTRFKTNDDPHGIIFGIPSKERKF